MNKKQMAGIKATSYISNGMIVGLGTGSTAFYMIRELGKLVKEGLKIKAVATSKSSEILAIDCKIPLVSIDEIERIDIAIDGVDEIDSSFNAIKGGGGALFREKMVATMANKVIWIMDESKLVDQIGKFPLPIEVLPFGHTHILNKLNEYNLNPVLRKQLDEPFVTDNGNYIIDLKLDKPIDINRTIELLNSIPGVLEHGLFINTCDTIIVGYDDRVDVVDNTSK